MLAKNPADIVIDNVGVGNFLQAVREMEICV